VHGALDAGALNIDVVSPTDFPIFSNINYSESSGYEEIPSAPYSFQLRASDDSQIFRKYAVDLSLSQAIGEAQTWIISGLADTLFADSNSQIGIWVATNSGGPLKELSTITGMDEIAFPTFHLFPNPASQSIQLSNSSNESIRILSMDGRVMMESSRSLQQIDVSTWPNGVYIVIVESKSSRQTQRITVIH